MDLHKSNVEFHFLQNLSDNIHEIVSFFRNHHKLNAALRLWQRERKVIALVKPGETRWGSYFNSMKSVKDNNQELVKETTNENFITDGTNAKEKNHRKKIQGMIVTPNWMTSINLAMSILSPIMPYITKFQSDSVPISEVFNMFLSIKNEYLKLLNDSKITYLQMMALHALVNARLDKHYKLVHGLSYNMDPRYFGQNLSLAQKGAVETHLSEFKLPNIEGNALNDLTKLKLDINIRNYHQAMVKELKDGSISTIEFYVNLSDSDYPHLKALGLKVFSLVISSCASERNFSAFTFIHSKLRNRLTDDRVNKLISIYVNEKIMRNTAKGYSWEDENCEDEIKEVEEILAIDNIIDDNNNDINDGNNNDS